MSSLTNFIDPFFKTERWRDPYATRDLDLFNDPSRALQMSLKPWGGMTDRTIAPLREILNPVDISESDTDFIVKMDLPGIVPDKISVELTEKNLIIRGHNEKVKETILRRERAVGDVCRTIPIPEGCNSHEAHTTLLDGVLTVTFPKLNPNKRGRKLVINHGELEGGESKSARVEGSSSRKGRTN